MGKISKNLSSTLNYHIEQQSCNLKKNETTCSLQFFVWKWLPFCHFFTPTLKFCTGIKPNCLSGLRIQWYIMRDNFNWLSTCHGCRVITLDRFSVFGIYFPNPRISAPWLHEIVRDHVGKACRKNSKNLNSLITTVNRCSRLWWCHLNACVSDLLCELKQTETAAYHRTEHHLL